MVKIAMIGAGSTIFMKNLIGDALQRESLADASVFLMDIDAQRLEESALVAKKMIASLGVGATVETTTNQRAALDGADFVIVAFQIGGYKPCTVTDFDIPNRYGLRQTIADTLGVGGIMRGLRTVPHLWSICADMAELCPEAILLQYVNPMAINTWAIGAKYPGIRQVGLCHSIQNTVEELCHDLDIAREEVNYRVAGINHLAFFLKFEKGGKSLYPELLTGYRAGRFPKPPLVHKRCSNAVRYEVFSHFGYFPTESSEHLAEYVPWFIKANRPDLIETFGIPLDEYPRRCEQQIADWQALAETYRTAERVEVGESHEYAATIMDAVVTGAPAMIYGNIPNRGFIPQLPDGAAVEVPYLVDEHGIQPTVVDDIPKHLIALMRTNVSVQELTVEALMTESTEPLYHAAMLDPHTAAELDLRQIRSLVDELLTAHGDWIPAWAQQKRAA